MQVDFDPDVVSYDQLLGEFLTMHDATRPAHSTQYASLVLCADDMQHEHALDALETLTPRYGRPALTRIEPLTTFYLAEDYHQKYALRSDEVLSEAVHGRYRDEAEFRDSTLAARLNGFAYGLGTAHSLARELDAYGLPSIAEARLRSLVRSAG